MLDMVMVNGPGRGARSLFSDPIRHSMGFGYRLGYQGDVWYARAQAAIAQFDALVLRTARISNKTVRDQIAAWVGDPDSTDTPRERYNTVVYDVNRAKSYTPLNTAEFERGQVQNRVGKLESYNGTFAGKVVDAENAYGILPEPVVIERFTNVSAPGGVPFWQAPLLIGAGLILAAGLFVLFTKKR